MHKAKNHDDAAPVQQKLCQLPFLVRQVAPQRSYNPCWTKVLLSKSMHPLGFCTLFANSSQQSVRLWVDFREPNKALIVDKHQLPHKDELLSELRDAAIFLTIDLAWAYNQLLLHTDSHDLTAIKHEGLFRFCHVPYGLASAHSAFQKMMETVLKDIRNWYKELFRWHNSLCRLTDWTRQNTTHCYSEVDRCWPDTKHAELHIQPEFSQLSGSCDLKRWDLARYSSHWSHCWCSNPTRLTFSLFVPRINFLVQYIFPEICHRRGITACSCEKCNVRNDPALLSFFLIHNEHNGLTMRGEHRFVVPASLHSILLNLAQETHQGLVRIKQRLREL